MSNMTELHYEELKKRHLAIGKEIIKADSGTMFPVDILALAALNRSLCLSRAFDELIKHSNFIAAAPLLRLQLDNALRLFALTLVSNPHELASKVFEGTPIRKMRDRDNVLMTDKHLSDKLNQVYPWVKRVYENTSGYIHLSDKHIWNMTRLESSDPKLTLSSMKISDSDSFVPESIYAEALESYSEITKIIYTLLDGWVFTKNNPVLSQSIKMTGKVVGQ